MVNDRGNTLPNIWCLCSEVISPSFIATSAQHCSFFVMVNNLSVCILAVYASTTLRGRRQLWNELTSLSVSNPTPWIYFGDFNAVMGKKRWESSS